VPVRLLDAALSAAKTDTAGTGAPKIDSVDADVLSVGGGDAGTVIPKNEVDEPNGVANGDARNVGLAKGDGESLGSLKEDVDGVPKDHLVSAPKVYNSEAEVDGVTHRETVLGENRKADGVETLDGTKCKRGGDGTIEVHRDVAGDAASGEGPLEADTD
jgi:hypothetical protein